MQAVSFVVYWLVVPLIFLRLLSFANEIKDFVKEEKQKWSAREESARVGFWAGILIAVVCISWQMSEGHDSFNPSTFNEYYIVGFGFLIGLLSFFGIKKYMKTIPHQVVGILTLFLSAISVLGLFSYIFIDSCRDLIFKVTLASAIGILLFLVFFPKTLENLKKP